MFTIALQPQRFWVAQPIDAASQNSDFCHCIVAARGMRRWLLTGFVCNLNVQNPADASADFGLEIVVVDPPTQNIVYLAARTPRITYLADSDIYTVCGAINFPPGRETYGINPASATVNEGLFYNSEHSVVPFALPEMLMENDADVIVTACMADSGNTFASMAMTNIRLSFAHVG